MAQALASEADWPAAWERQKAVKLGKVRAERAAKRKEEEVRSLAWLGAGPFGMGVVRC